MPDAITPATVANDGDRARRWMDEGKTELAGVLALIAQAEASAGIMATLIEISDTLKGVKSDLEASAEEQLVTRGDVQGIFQQGIGDLAHTITESLENGLAVNPNEDTHEYTRRVAFLIANAIDDYGQDRD